MVRIRSLNIAVLLIGATQLAYADYDPNQFDCIRVDYHQKPPFPWAKCDTEGKQPGSLASHCKKWNQGTGGKMTCKFDTASFDKHFAAEAKKPKENDRDNNDPTSGCTASLQYLLTDGDSLNQFMTEKAVAKEVNAKVKNLVCRYEEDAAKAWILELKGSDLIMTIGLGTPQPPSAFMVEGMRKYFPAFKASWDEHH